MAALMSNGVNPDAVLKLLVDDEIRKPAQAKGSFASVAKKCLAARVLCDGVNSGFNSNFKGGGCFEGKFRIIRDGVVQFLNGFGMEDDRLHPSQVFAANLGKDFIRRHANHTS